MTETPPHANNFSYERRELRVVFATGAVDRVGEAIDATIASTRCLVVTTPGRKILAERVRSVLGPHAVAVFDRAMPHVPASSVKDALALVNGSDADCLVAAGGGSAIGLGKAVAKRTGLPLVAIPTTYSGSEMTDIWGITDGGKKQTGRDNSAAPRLVVYDPELSRTMPPDVTAASGMNAVAHAIEAMYSPSASPVSTLLAREGLTLLVKVLPVLMRAPLDVSARGDALAGAHLCGVALDMTTMGLHHKLCHVLGGSYDLPHALAHAILLPYVCAYNAAGAKLAMTTLASALGVSDPVRGIWEFRQGLGLTQNLGDLGVRTDDIPRIIESLTYGQFPNPVLVTEPGLVALLTHAIQGQVPSSGPDR